jgi:AcrR family transcriptional regulator
MESREKTPQVKMGRREQKKAETAQRIAAAGRKLLRSKGFDGITTQEVAIAAGIPPGTLFGYITNKTDLLILALVHEAIEFVETIPPRVPAKAEFLEKIHFVFSAMAEYHARDVEVSKHFLRELMISRNPGLAKQAGSLGNAVRGVVAQVVAAHQAAGDITSALPAEKVSWFLFAQYWQSLRFWMNGVFTQQQFSTSLKEALVWQIAGLKPEAADAAAALAPVRPRNRKMTRKS